MDGIFLMDGVLIIIIMAKMAVFNMAGYLK